MSKNLQINYNNKKNNSDSIEINEIHPKTDILAYSFLNSSLIKYLNYLKHEKKYSINTVVSYKTDIIQFLDYINANIPNLLLKDIKEKNIRYWIISLIKSSISSRSVNRKIVSIKRFFNFLNKRKICLDNPISNISSLKFTKKLPHFISETDMLNFLDSNLNIENTNIASQDAQNITKIDKISNFETMRDQLIFELLYGTGMRLSELINLRCKDIIHSKKELIITGKGQKQRIVPVPAKTYKILVEYLKYRETSTYSAKAIENEDFVILTSKGKKAYPMLIQRIVSKNIKNITNNNINITPHSLRHTYATHLLDHGSDLMSIKELLGHSNLSSTQIYTHLSIEKLKNIVKKSHPRG